MISTLFALILQQSVAATAPSDEATLCAQLGHELAGYALDYTSEESYRTRFAFEDCAQNFADDGRSALDIASAFRPLLESPHLYVRLLTIQLLGHLGDRESLDTIRARLESRDRNEVLTAIDAISRLGDETDFDRMAALSAHHWDPDVRSRARYFSATYLGEWGSYGSEPLSEKARSGSRRPRRLSTYQFWEWDEVAPPRHEICDSERFRFRDWEASWHDRIERPTYQNALEVELGGERLVARNRGEWGGELAWIPEAGDEVVLIGENIAGVLPQPDGNLLVVAGLAHLSLNYGSLFRVKHEDGALVAEPLGSLPGAPYWIVDLGGGAVGIRVRAGLVVVDEYEFLGVGHCEPGERAGTRF